MFQNSFFVDNRKRLRSIVNDDLPIIVTANGLLQRSADMAFTFHQDSSFWYLTGVEEPDAILVMYQNEEYLILPQREGVRAAFDGVVDFEYAKEISGIAAVYEPKQGDKRLQKLVKAVKSIATADAPPPYVDFYGMYTNPARARLLSFLKKANSDLGIVDIRDQLGRLRQIKQPVEIAAIQQAIDITIDGILAAKDSGCHNERDAEASLTAYFRRQGSGHAFDPIIAGGRNACTLHYLANNSPIEPNALLMFDVGASYNHYAADISRTYAPSGKPTDRQAAVHRAVEAVQDYALGLLKPGILVRKYEKQVEQYMGEQLRALGLIEELESDAIRRYYPHATSHYLGIDPHDVGDYDQKLEPGCVLTCEPGIYIPEEGIGVRIEDDILITDDGNVNLSARLPRELA